MAIFEEAINTTLCNEGGSKFTRDPTDRGGSTKWGISQSSYPNLNIEALTETEAKAIYRRDYWDRVRGDDIEDQEVAGKIFDLAVNMGVKTVSRLVQLVLDIRPVDGVIGKESIAMINKADPDRLIKDITLAGVARYVAICNGDKSQTKFLLGWLNRVMK